MLPLLLHGIILITGTTSMLRSVTTAGLGDTIGVTRHGEAITVGVVGTTHGIVHGTALGTQATTAGTAAGMIHGIVLGMQATTATVGDTHTMATAGDTRTMVTMVGDIRTMEDIMVTVDTIVTTTKLTDVH